MNENEEINTDEILIGNFIHDRLRRNCIFLHMIEHPQYTNYKLDASVKRLRCVKNVIPSKWKCYYMKS